LLPSYYSAGRLEFGSFGGALAGNLISPSRGLVVYVPWVLMTVYWLWRYRQFVEQRWLLWLSLSIVAGELFVLGAFPVWWGGVSYGARLTTDLLPWLVFLTILALHARSQSVREDAGRSFKTVEIIAASLLALFSVFVNGRGAISAATQSWNDYPKDDHSMQEKVWSWRQAQFLAGCGSPEPPPDFPELSSAQTMDPTKPESEEYLWLGWARAERDWRWTNGKEAKIVFGLNEGRDLNFTMTVAPFLVPNQLSEQVVIAELNGHSLRSFTVRNPAFAQLAFTLPANFLKDKNVLTLKLPNATSPESLRMSIDQRQLGLAVREFGFK
jgi:hypothetical protein